MALLILLICGTFLRLTKILLFNLGHGISKQFLQGSSLLLVRLMTQHIKRVRTVAFKYSMIEASK